MRTTYVFRNGKFVEKGSEEDYESSKGPIIISDEMDAVQHPCNGLWYESKSAFRKTTKAHGCVEVGS